MKRIIISLACLLGILSGIQAARVTDRITMEALDFYSYGTPITNYNFYGRTMNSEAVYCGCLISMGTLKSSNINIRPQDGHGIATTHSGGIIKKITFKLHQAMSLQNVSRTFELRGRTLEMGAFTDPNPYEDPNDDSEIMGMPVIQGYDKPVSFTPSKDYSYVAIHVVDGGVLLDYIEIEWEAPSGVTADPVFATPGGEYESAQSVALSSDPGAVIWYTTDGTDPSLRASTAVRYTGPISVTGTTVIRAYAQCIGKSDSKVVTAQYTIADAEEQNVMELEAPHFSEPAGKYTSALLLTMMSTGEGADIYYTLDESTPTVESTLYTGPLTLNSTTTVKAIAVHGSLVSPVAEATYTFELSGIEGVDADAAPAVYYNLKGIRVAVPMPGIPYIEVRGNKATKVVF